MSIAAHLRTVVPRLRERLSPPPAPPSVPWSTTVEDPRVGTVRLSGRLSDPTAGADGGDPDGHGRPLVLLVHGLGGSAEAYYLRRAAQVAVAAGWACLRFNLRGADLGGDDFFHAGLTGDLHAALASPALASYRPVYALGYSLGGSFVLRMAAEEADPRLAAVAAVAPPLDLAACAEAFDRPRRAFYRSYLLAGLKEMYAAVAARRPVPLPAEEARRIRRIQEWDDRLVAPHHGFAGCRDYYGRTNAGQVLGRLRRPALVVAAEDDPLVPAAALKPSLAAAGPEVEAQWLDAGGHLGFSDSAELDAQLFGWLAARG